MNEKSYLIEAKIDRLRERKQELLRQDPTVGTEAWGRLLEIRATLKTLDEGVQYDG